MKIFKKYQFYLFGLTMNGRVLNKPQEKYCTLMKPATPNNLLQTQTRISKSLHFILFMTHVYPDMIDFFLFERTMIFLEKECNNVLWLSSYVSWHFIVHVYFFLLFSFTFNFYFIKLKTFTKKQLWTLIVFQEGTHFLLWKLKWTFYTCWHILVSVN